MRRRFDLTDKEWTIIKRLLPQKSRGVPRVEDRRVINGILWRVRRYPAQTEPQAPPRLVGAQRNHQRASTAAGGGPLAGRLGDDVDLVGLLSPMIEAPSRHTIPSRATMGDARRQRPSQYGDG